MLAARGGGAVVAARVGGGARASGGRVDVDVVGGTRIGAGEGARATKGMRAGDGGATIAARAKGRTDVARSASTGAPAATDDRGSTERPLRAAATAPRAIFALLLYASLASMPPKLPLLRAARVAVASISRCRTASLICRSLAICTAAPPSTGAALFSRLLAATSCLVYSTHRALMILMINSLPSFAAADMTLVP